MKPKKRTKNIYRHIFQLSKFLSSSVLLQSLDVYTDVTTAISFLKQNHLHWAIATLFFVYLPFIANIATYLYGFISIFIEMWQDKISRQVWKVKMNLHYKDGATDLVWHLPPFPIVRLSFLSLPYLIPKFSFGNVMPNT